MENDTLFVSKNYTAYKTLSNGPIRTDFTLDYADWKSSDKTIKEQKQINLDLGSNMSHVQIKVEGSDFITVGLTLHKKLGEIAIDTVNGWFSYWEPIDSSEMGVGIVCNPDILLGYQKIITETPDFSHILVQLKVVNGMVDYYTGFGWKKSGQYTNNKEWDSYLESFSEKLKNPLTITVLAK